MKLPKIALIQKGRADKSSRKLIYIRYAVNGKTHWLSLGISVAESNWDVKKQLVKNRDVDAAKFNQVFRAYKMEAEQIVLDLFIQSKNALVPFDLFKKAFLKEQPPEKLSAQPPVSLLLETIDQMFEEKEISAASRRAYRAAVRSFMQVNLATTLNEATPSIVASFHRKLIQEHNENLAAQYFRNLAIVFRHTVRRNSLKIPDPFTEKKITVKRISEKKTLSPAEYQKLIETFNATGIQKEREILRRFFVLCKGLRFSDTVHLHQRDLQEFKQDGETIKYFNRPAQKSGIAGMIVFYNEDELLQFDKKGFLFSKVTLGTYNAHLGKLTEKIIGRPISSHYGRHFAGDQAINSDFDIDDVKAILGISNESTARIYAQRQNTKILTKLLTYEKNKKNSTDR